MRNNVIDRSRTHSHPPTLLAFGAPRLARQLFCPELLPFVRVIQPMPALAVLRPIPHTRGDMLGAVLISREPAASRMQARPHWFVCHLLYLRDKTKRAQRPLTDRQ